MDKEYLSVSGQFQSEFIVERSRFISYCDRVKSEEEARAFVEKIKKQNSLATHNCYAFIADETANLMRFSDDGEPQGTAGVPILDVIKNRNLRQTAVVVTRYFGGIKLGAGGLCRAYSRAASDVVYAWPGAVVSAVTPKIAAQLTAIDIIKEICVPGKIISFVGKNKA